MANKSGRAALKQNPRVYHKNPVKQVWSDMRQALFGYEGAFYDKALLNYMNFWYAGKIYMGSERQE